MIKHKCDICNDSGWVCEDHQHLPFNHDDCGGAGDPCVCNPDGDVRDHIVLSLACIEGLVDKVKKWLH